MKTFDDLEHKPHAHWPGGTSAKLFFDNGYGVSVVRGGEPGAMGFLGSYGCDQGLYELAVLQGNSDSWELTYETPITDDVVGHLTEQGVTDLMQQVQELPEIETA